MPRNHLLQIRRDTAANWTSTDPTLAAGELGLETDTGTVKAGDGATAWSALDPINKGTYADRHLFISALPAPNGQSGWSSGLTQRNDRWFTGERNVDNGGFATAYLEWDLVLGAGTWTITLFHNVGTARPIYHFKFDGTEVGTIDGYAGSSANAVSTLTGVTVAAAGRILVRITNESKNASSSGYWGSISAIALTRTGA